MSNCVKCDKAFKLIKETEKKIKQLPTLKDESLDADAIKTLKAVCYERVKAIMKGEK
jgi:hypothetical protein